MPGKKRKFTPKGDRMAGHVAASERAAGKSAAEAKRIGYATVNARKAAGTKPKSSTKKKR